MTHVTVSSKFQVVIPQEIREQLGIKKGQKMLVVAIGNRIEYVPDRDISELRGYLRGMPTDNIREEEDRY